jgi:hypothetical protein
LKELSRRILKALLKNDFLFCGQDIDLDTGDDLLNMQLGEKKFKLLIILEE